MLQQIVRKYKSIGILLFFILLTSFNSTNSNFVNIFFPIKVIEYSKTSFLKESSKSKVNNFLKNKSLLWINEKKTKNLFNKHIWVESVVFTKKFPDTLQIHISEYYPIAYFKKKKLIYLINSNFNHSLIDNDSNVEDLIEVKNMNNIIKFKTFFSKIKNYDFFFSEIKVINCVYENRWNVILKNGQLIKFGNYNVNKQVEYLNFILNNQTAKIIDMRYDGRVIVTNE